MFDHIESQFRAAAREARDEGERAGYGDECDGRDEPHPAPAPPINPAFRALCEAAVAAQREQDERYRAYKAASQAAYRERLFGGRP